jgi:RecB family exonuclease
LPAIECPGWQGRIAIRKRAPEHWNAESMNRKTQRGSRIHEILSEIRTGDDIPAAIHRALQAGTLALDERTETETLLRAILGHDLLNELFSAAAQVRTEAEILLPGGEFYRPDRVVHHDGQTTVIDYKTGRPSAAHRVQLDRYAALLASMGYGTIRKLLVYLGDSIEVTEL